MSDLEALLADVMADNLALRSLLTGLLIELIRRGQIGMVSNALSYARVPLEGLAREKRPSVEVREKASRTLEELRDELLGSSETGEPTASEKPPPASQST